MHMATFCALRSSLKLLSQKSKRSERKCFCHSGSHRHPILFVVWETQNGQAVAFEGSGFLFSVTAVNKYFIDYKYWLANACTATFIMRICQNMNQIKCKHLEVKKKIPTKWEMLYEHWLGWIISCKLTAPGTISELTKGYALNHLQFLRLTALLTRGRRP